MEQIISKLGFRTHGEGFTDITNDLNLFIEKNNFDSGICLLYTSPSPRDLSTSRMPSSA